MGGREVGLRWEERGEEGVAGWRRRRPELDEKWGRQEDGGASGKFRERGSRNQPTEGWRGAAEMNRHDAGGAPSN